MAVFSAIISAGMIVYGLLKSSHDRIVVTCERLYKEVRTGVAPEMSKLDIGAFKPQD